MLKHTCEGYDLSTTLVNTVTDNLIHRIERRCNVGERSVFRCLLHAYFLNVKPVINLEIVTYMSHIEGIETGLRLRECGFHLTHLQYLSRMIRRHTECLSTIYNIFTKSESQRGNTLLCRLFTNGIIVQ